MKSVSIPKHLENRPRFKGLPIPFIALIKPDGQPDFRVTDLDAWREVVGNRSCQLCGEKLGKYIFFVGGTEAAKHNQYFEPAAHLDCVLYAMQVCPFIAGRIEHADPGKVKSQMPEGIELIMHKSFTVVSNPYWVIQKATGYGLMALSDTEVLLNPKGVIFQTGPLHAESMTAQDWSDVEQLLKGAK